MKDMFSNDNSFSNNGEILNFSAYSASAMLLFNRIGAFSKEVHPVLIVAAKMVTARSVESQVNAARNKNYSEMSAHSKALYCSLKSLADEHKIAYDILQDFDALQKPLFDSIKFQLNAAKVQADFLTEEKMRQRIEQIAEEIGGVAEGWELGDDIPDEGEEEGGGESDEIEKLINKQSKDKPTTSTKLADDIDENDLRKKSITELKILESKYASAEKYEIASRIVKIIDEKQKA